MRKRLLTGLVALVGSLGLAATASSTDQTTTVRVIAAEGFYGDIAVQIGGDRVTVISILTDPAQDPHDFEITPATARLIADADIVVFNGADYDPWVPDLLAANGTQPATIVAADLIGWRDGENPHLWFDPRTIPLVAAALADSLAEIDPARSGEYRARLEAFEQTLATIEALIDDIRQSFEGAAVTATEPVFNLMADAIGLTMLNERFQLDITNETEPAARDVADFQASLRNGAAQVLFYNEQVTSDLTIQLLDLARSSGVAVVGVSETLPPNVRYQDWIVDLLERTRAALNAE